MANQPLFSGGRRAWIIADMDSTIVERPPSGLFPTLQVSPCLEPLLEWLRLGGGVCVVTTAAKRSISQVWDCVPRELRAHGALVLSALEGADLVYGDDEGEMVADKEFLENAAKDSGPTCFQGNTLLTLLSFAEAMVHGIYKDMLQDRSILAALSKKYHGTVAVMLDRMAAGEAVEDVLTRRVLTTEGTIMSATGERYVSFNTPIWADDIYAIDADDEIDAKVCTISIMGFPAKHSGPYWKPYVDRAAAVGADLSAAPNSLWFTPAGVSKATPITWLRRHAAKYAFDLSNAVAFGDCPHSNDFPLTQLELEVDAGAPAYCPFVSVAAPENAEKVPAHVAELHVGGLEFGTARVVQGLIDAVKDAQRTDPAACPSVAALLPSVVQHIRQATTAGVPVEAIDGREV